MDEDTIKKAGVSPLKKILDQVADYFPTQASASPKSLLKTSDEDEIVDTILFLAKLGVSALVSTGAGADDTDPDTVVVQVSSPWRIGLPAKDYYKDERVLKSYQDTLAQVLASLYPEDEHHYASEVVDFEKKLAAASPNAEDQSDVTVGFLS